MVRSKIFILLVFLALSIGFTSALNFEVDVDAKANATAYEADYENSTSGVHEFSATVENWASIGCTYRLKGVYKQKNGEKDIHYSNGYAMWPGTTEEMRLVYLPENYTGIVEADVELTYCGFEEDIASFEFNSTERTVSDARIDSSTINVNSSSAEIGLSIDNGTLIPKEMPPYWKAGHAEVKEGKATLSYDPTIFRNDKELTYSVLDADGNLVGETTVKLVEPEPTLVEKLRSNMWAIFAGLFGISTVVNLYLARRVIVPEWVREYVADIEFGGRDIRKS